MDEDTFRDARVIAVGEAAVAYRMEGSGPAVVFLHGFPLSGLTWRNVVPALSPRFTCYALDLVGLGGTTSPNLVDYSSEGQARVFARALSALGVGEFSLAGNDTGGWIARELALLDPARVTRLALTNTEMPGHRPPWIPMYQALVRVPGSRHLVRRMLASTRFRRSAVAFGGCFADRDLIEGDFAREFVSPLLRSKERLAGMFTFLKQMKFSRIDQFRELHGRLSMPVAFLWGEDDPTFPVGLARRMASRFPNVVGFETLPRGKVFLHEEFPAAVAAWLNRLLGSVPSPEAG